MNRDLDGAEIALSLVAVAATILALYSGWLPEASLLASTVAGLVAWPVLTLVHELGHALVAVALTPGRAMIRLGGDERHVVALSVGRIDLRWSGGVMALCEHHPAAGFGRARMVAIAVAGPAAEIAVASAVVVGIVTASDGSAFLTGAAFGVALTGFVGALNLLPFRHGAYASDGLQVLAALLAPRHEGEEHVCGPACPCLALEALGREGWDVVLDAARRAAAEGAPAITASHLEAALDAPARMRSEEARTDLAPDARRALRGAYYALSLRGDQEIGPGHLRDGIARPAA